MSDAPEPVVVDGGQPLVIAGEYEPGEGGAPVVSYRVQVGTDDRLREIVSDTKVPAEVRRFEIRAPAPGHYYARVSAIDDDNFEGPFGRAAWVLVVRATMTSAGSGRRLEILPADAACVRVGNVPLVWTKGAIDLCIREPVRLGCAA